MDQMNSAIDLALARKRPNCLLCLGWGRRGPGYGCRNGHRAVERTLRIAHDSVILRRERMASGCRDYEPEV